MGVVITGAHEHHVAAVVFDLLNLALRGGFGNDDGGGLQAQQLGGVGHGDAVVPGGNGGDAMILFLLGQLQNAVQCTPQLEGFDGLLVLQLEVNAVGFAAEVDGVIQCGLHYVGCYAISGLDDILIGKLLDAHWKDPLNNKFPELLHSGIIAPPSPVFYV